MCTTPRSTLCLSAGGAAARPQGANPLTAAAAMSIFPSFLWVDSNCCDACQGGCECGYDSSFCGGQFLRSRGRGGGRAGGQRWQARRAGRHAAADRYALIAFPTNLPHPMLCRMWQVSAASRLAGWLAVGRAPCCEPLAASPPMCPLHAAAYHALCGLPADVELPAEAALPGHTPWLLLPTCRWCDCPAWCRCPQCRPDEIAFCMMNKQLRQHQHRDSGKVCGVRGPSGEGGWRTRSCRPSCKPCCALFLPPWPAVPHCRARAPGQSPLRACQQAGSA